MRTDSITVEDVRPAGRLQHSGEAVFTARVVGEPERRITFRADRLWARILRTYVASHGDGFQTDVKPEDVIRPAE